MDLKIKKNLEKLKQHPKKDKDGKPFSKKHITLMRKFILEGLTFTQAHNKASKEENGKVQASKKKNNKTYY
jgi:hypothetical protein